MEETKRTNTLCIYLSIFFINPSSALERYTIVTPFTHTRAC